MSPIVKCCLSKTRFVDTRHAEQEIRRWETMGYCPVGTLEPYHCPACEGAHVTTKRGH